MRMQRPGTTAALHLKQHCTWVDELVAFFHVLQPEYEVLACPRASRSHRMPSRTPATATGPAQRIASAGSAALASPAAAACETTPPACDAIFTACREHSCSC